MTEEVLENHHLKAFVAQEILFLHYIKKQLIGQVFIDSNKVYIVRVSNLSL